MVTAAYSGDVSFNARTSQPQTFTITPAATTTTVIASGAPQGLTFTATVGTTSGGNSPAGSILFTVNGVSASAPLAGIPAVLNPITDAIKTAAQSTATFTTSNLGAGQNYSVTAAYSGDGNYLTSSGSANGSVQPDFGISANPSSVTITPGQSPTFTVSATLLSGYAGTVNFAPSSCSSLPPERSCSFSPGVINGSGSAVLTVATMGPHQVVSAKAQEPFQKWEALMATVLIGRNASFRFVGSRFPEQDSVAPSHLRRRCSCCVRKRRWRLSAGFF